MSGEEMTVYIELRMQYAINDPASEAIGVLGSCDALGNWTPSQAIVATASSRDYWTATALLPSAATVSWKWVLLEKPSMSVKRWEERDNRLLTLCGRNMVIYTCWNSLEDIQHVVGEYKETGLPLALNKVSANHKKSGADRNGPRNGGYHRKTNVGQPLHTNCDVKKRLSAIGRSTSLRPSSVPTVNDNQGENFQFNQHAKTMAKTVSFPKQVVTSVVVFGDTDSEDSESEPMGLESNWLTGLQDMDTSWNNADTARGVTSKSCPGTPCPDSWNNADTARGVTPISSPGPPCPDSWNNAETARGVTSKSSPGPPCPDSWNNAGTARRVTSKSSPGTPCPDTDDAIASDVKGHSLSSSRIDATAKPDTGSTSSGTSDPIANDTPITLTDEDVSSCSGTMAVAKDSTALLREKLRKPTPDFVVRRTDEGDEVVMRVVECPRCTSCKETWRYAGEVRRVAECPRCTSGEETWCESGRGRRDTDSPAALYDGQTDVDQAPIIPQTKQPSFFQRLKSKIIPSRQNNNPDIRHRDLENIKNVTVGVVGAAAGASITYLVCQKLNNM